LKVRSASLLALLLNACEKPQAPQSFDYGTSLGVAVEQAAGVCLDIRNVNLHPGQRIQFVNSSLPQTTGEVEITGTTGKACTSTDQNKPGLLHYQVKVARGSLQKSAPAFVLANSRGVLTEAKTGATADLDGDGQLESFHACTSSEGVHLTVWTGKPLEGLRKWHYYYYLGFDVEPTCKEAETKE